MKQWNNMVTLVVPTARTEFMRRLLGYCKAADIQLPILILDSSPGGSVRELVKELHGKNVSYHRYDPDFSVYEKFYDGVKRTQTPYIKFWADDDFIVPSTVLRSAQFLEQHADYAVVHGTSWIFGVSGVNGKRYISGAAPYAQSSIEDDVAFERLARHFGSYTTTFYSVHRTADLKENYRHFMQYDMNHQFFELALCGLSLIQGKVGKVDGLFMLKQTHHVSKKSYNPSLKTDFFDVVMSKEYRDNYFLWAECLSVKLAEREHISIQDAAKSVKLAFWTYLSDGLRQKLRRKFSEGNTSGAGGLTRTKVPAGIKQLVNYPVRLLRGTGVESLSFPLKAYARDIKLIKDAVRTFDDMGDS